MNSSTPVKDRSDFIWNFLTVLFLLGTILILAGTAFLYVFSDSSANPLRPPTLPAALILPTRIPDTPTPPVLPPTWTPTPSQTPQPSTTPTPVDIVGGTVQAGTPEATITSTPNTSWYSFAVLNNIEAVSSTLYRQDQGCQWQGVAGRVFDIQNRPTNGIRVHIRGYLDGKYIDIQTLSGTAPAYGPSGFEFTLGDVPKASKGSIWIQILDQADLPLTDRIYFDTFSDCDKNLILINFKQTR